MSTKSIANPLWSTASFEDTGDRLPTELSVLGQHFDRCRGGRWFAMRSGADRINRFVASRFVTTLVVGALLIGAGLLVT